MTVRREQPPIGEDDLHAFADERLDAARLALVRRYLDEHLEAAARAHAFADQRDALRAALAAGASEPIPARLRVAHVRAELRARRRQRLRAAAAALLLLAGAGAGWLARGGAAENGVSAVAAAPAPAMAEAAEAHRLFAGEAGPSTALAATDPDDLAAWLGDRLGAPVVVPDLLAAGFRPLGGHLLPAPQGAASVVTYERVGGGTRLSFYMRPAPGEPEAKLACVDHPGGRVTYYWFDGRHGYAVTAALPRSELRGIAFLAEREVRAGPRPAAREVLARGPTPRVCVG